MTKMLIILVLEAFLITGCMNTTKWIEFPHSDGAGLSDDKTGRLTWEWMGHNIKLFVDGKKVFVNGPYVEPDFQKQGVAAKSVRLLPGMHTVNYYIDNRSLDYPLYPELTFEVKAGHQYRIKYDSCLFSGKGIVWIEDTTSKRIVARYSNCVEKADTIKATYVSPLQYEDYSCNQLKDEMLRVNKRLTVISGQQAVLANRDVTVMAVGLTFWPGLFFLPQVEEDQKAEIGSLKGQYNAIRDVATKKNCDFAAGMVPQEAIKSKTSQDNLELLN